MADRVFEGALRADLIRTDQVPYGRWSRRRDLTNLRIPGGGITKDGVANNTSAALVRVWQLDNGVAVLNQIATRACPARVITLFGGRGL